MTDQRTNKIPDPRPVSYDCPVHGLFAVPQVYGASVGRAALSSPCPGCKRSSPRVRDYSSCHVSVSAEAYQKMVLAAEHFGWTLTKLVNEATKDVKP